MPILSIAKEAVAKECERIGMRLPHREYRHDERALQLEELEFAAADRLLCPAAFPEQSFLNLGFPPEKLARHAYGFDDNKYFPDMAPRDSRRKFTALFVGVDPVRKGLHLALKAWLSSPAAQDGTFMIAGELSAEFKDRFAKELSHPSVAILGHRKDVPELMRGADVLFLPSLEEGSALVCSEAIGSGCVPLVSNACSDACRHMENALVHHVGDVTALQEHIAIVYGNRELLGRLREGAVRSRSELTWSAAGRRLFGVYQDVVASVLPASSSVAVAS